MPGNAYTILFFKRADAQYVKTIDWYDSLSFTYRDVFTNRIMHSLSLDFLHKSEK